MTEADGYRVGMTAGEARSEGLATGPVPDSAVLMRIVAHVLIEFTDGERGETRMGCFMNQIIEQFLRAAMRAHHEHLSDFCQECQRTGKEIAARRAQGTQHHCTQARRCRCDYCLAFEKARL